MNPLTAPWEHSDEFVIESSLEKLYTFQDRPLSKDKRSLLVESLRNTGYPAKAIIIGLNDLMKEDLKSIKFPHILEAVRKHIEPEAIETTRCDHCWESGIIHMKMKIGQYTYQHIFACQCFNGIRFKQGKNSLVGWNGQQHQQSNGRRFTLEPRG